MAAAQLSFQFYEKSCPLVLSIINLEVQDAVSNEAHTGPSLLRLHFHDCLVEGCDASVLLDDAATFPGEKTAVPDFNSGRGFEVIDTVKCQLESSCPASNWVDRRRDSTTASLDLANSDLPGPDMSLGELISAFADKGLTAEEMAALSGARTIGQAPTDIDPLYEVSLREKKYASAVSVLVTT
ncbi:hypothetical protein CUMW_001090, partial [Citrus unshiu]